MRKFYLVAVAVCLVFLLAGCAKAEKMSVQFGDEVVSDVSAEQITDLLSDGTWVNSVSNCAADYVISIDGCTIRYHSECGTFCDITNGRSLALSDGDRDMVNEMLKSLFASGEE